MGRFETKTAPETKAVETKQKPVRKWEPLVKTVTVLVTLAVIAAVGYGMFQNYVYFTGITPVLLTGDEIDLRDARMTVQEYEKLAQRLPDSRIIWSVPVSGQYFESTSEHIVIDALSAQDISALNHFENLKIVDAQKCTDHEALKQLQEAYPQLEVNWNVHLDGTAWERDAELVDLRESEVSFEALQNTLGYFQPDTQIWLGSKVLTDEQIQNLIAAFPELKITWGIDLMGQKYSSSDEVLSFAGKTVDVAALVGAANQFFGVKEIDLTGCGCSLDDLTAISNAYPGVLIRSELTLFGLNLTTEAQEMDLSGIRMDSTDLVEQAVKLMPNLKKVIMSDCGFTNEQMDELNKRYENIQFVWTVYFSVYSLRTDAQAFCASDLPSHGYIAIKMNNEQLEPLKYCTELIALDLGHMYYKDLSFLKDMHKLQYLVLVDARFEDISVLAQMKELKFLEIFKNTITDLSPLLECKNLKNLNIGYTRGFDASPLKQMTWLERLWFPGHGLSAEQKQEIVDALPDTEVYMPAYDANGSTGGGWRETDEYYEMRNLFNMFYQPAGTGTNKNN